MLKNAKFQQNPCISCQKYFEKKAVKVSGVCSEWKQFAFSLSTFYDEWSHLSEWHQILFLKWIWHFTVTKFGHILLWEKRNEVDFLNFKILSTPLIQLKKLLKNSSIFFFHVIFNIKDFSFKIILCTRHEILNERYFRNLKEIFFIRDE